MDIEEEAGESFTGGLVRKWGSTRFYRLEWSLTQFIHTTFLAHTRRFGPLQVNDQNRISRARKVDSFLVKTIVF